MATLLIKFIIPLERYDLDEFNRPHGPLFHRWLPDGENDRISINTKSKDIKFYLWFERCGFVQKGWIQFDYKKREIDPLILKRQAVLDAGPLRGMIELKRIKQTEIKAITGSKEGDANYIRLGKRLRKIINENVIPFIDTLRLYYGQYWLRELPKWDSKTESLGSYFRHIYTKYSTDNGKKWNNFIPDKIKAKLEFTSIIRSDYSSYFTKDDWYSLNNFSAENFEHTFGIKLLLNAQQLKDTGDYKQSFVDGITSLEIALSDFFKARLSLPQKLKKEMESFWQLPLKAQLTVIASSLKSLSYEDINNAIVSIDTRNKIVHEGWSPKKDIETKKTLNSLFRVVSKLITDKPVKFPSSSGSNTLFPPNGEKVE